MSGQVKRTKSFRDVEALGGLIPFLGISVLLLETLSYACLSSFNPMREVRKHLDHSPVNNGLVLSRQAQCPILLRLFGFRDSPGSGTEPFTIRHRSLS